MGTRAVSNGQREGSSIDPILVRFECLRKSQKTPLPFVFSAFKVCDCTRIYGRAERHRSHHWRSVFLPNAITVTSSQAAHKLTNDPRQQRHWLRTSIATAVGLFQTCPAEKGDAAVKDLHSRKQPGTVELLQLDVASEESITAAAKTVESRHGRYARTRPYHTHQFLLLSLNVLA